MKRFLTLPLLLATILAVAACGGSDTGRSERATPTEPRQTQAESAQQGAPGETAHEMAPADSSSAESEQGATQEDQESSSLHVTTIEGEEVKLGGQGEVTALFFMAGW